MFAGVALMVLFLMGSGTVEMIKQFPEDAARFYLSFHGDVVYIGGYHRVIQWNVVTDAVVRFEGYPSMTSFHLFLLAWIHIVFSDRFWSRRLP